jgi:HAD superfamily hydrolase (TIGR01509 family)
MIKLIIFDLDGVLVSSKESKEMHYQALNDALMGIDEKYVISRDDHLSIYDGLSTNKKLKLLTETKGLPEKYYNEIWERKQEITWADIRENFSENLRLISILKKLTADGYQLCCASNAVRRSVMLMLLKKGILEYFDFYLSNQDVTRSKPFPEMYWKAMSIAGKLPKETLIIEDSHTGREGAVNSGAYLLGIKDEPDLTYDLIKDRIEQIGENIKVSWQNNNLQVLIPMAGAGKRFEQAGYTFPKPLISVHGKPMIQVVVENINIDAKHIFIVQEKHNKNYSMQHLFKLLKDDHIIVLKDSNEIKGAAWDVLRAEKYIDNDKSLLIANSDQFMEWDSNRVMYQMESSDIDGGILTFNATHPKWSFVRLDNNGYVVEVAEKKPISNIATIGVYYWRRGSDFVRYAKQMIKKDIKTNGEFYVAPVYNEAIADGKKVKPFFIEKMYGLGTPEDLEYFLKKEGR